MPDHLLTTDPERAVEALRRGGLVGLPTETVYGLAADATNPSAVERIFAVKGRPNDHPLIVHLGSEVPLDGWAAAEFPWRDAFELLAATVWPGPLTMIVPAGPLVLGAVTGGRRTVALRRPGHAVADAVLNRFGSGVAAPSANRFGRVSPTTAEHVLADIGERLDPTTDVVLDGGPSEVGVESTIVDLSGTELQVLRHGAITAEEITALTSTATAPASGPSRASGMLAAHYAPSTTVVLAESIDEAEQRSAEFARSGLAVRVLDRTADLVAAARSLYADLRQADADGLDILVAVLPPPTGLGYALRDRLGKAATGSALPSRAD